MKDWKIFIIFTCLLVPIFGSYQSADAQENLAQQAYAVFEQNCLNCHGEHGAFIEEIIIDHTALIETGAVVPGNPIESELYKRLRTNDLAKRMPLGQPKLPPAAILTIGNWIQAGAPDWQMPERDTAFITPTEMLKTIEKHVNSLSPFDRTFTRYFTLTHLYNAGESAEALHAYQRALSKLVNSLSWGREVIRPQPIDSEETIFYIDLRDYEWEIGTNRWTQIEEAYPYSIEFDAPTQMPLREKLTNLREAMDCEVPFVHVDWFIATASLPPLYHDILDLPQTDRELEARLEVNVVENIRNALGKRVWRAGFNDSGVSANNRVVERHRSRYGAYWKSYDFAGNVGTQSVFTHPLSFEHDGGEIIFNLPNGLQAYYLVDAGGNRLDEAPIEIVRNPAASDPTVRNGLSCIGCHTEGMKTFEDQVRGVVEQNPNPPFNKDRALRLYVETAEMDEFLAEDTARYRQALEKTGGVFGGIEPVQRFHEAFQRPLDAAHAAAAVGLDTADLLQNVRENANLKNLGLAVLTGPSGSVKRDTWTSNFSEIVATLSSPDSGIVKPVSPRTERIPGATVHIPDANLRAAIAEALGKTSNAPITSAEMETLKRLEAGKMKIIDLEGLQFATNLSWVDLYVNNISDVSPLAGLTELWWLSLSSNNISDVSPLAGLTKLRVLWLYYNNISDVSPLAGLTELTDLSIRGNNISDVSPLSGLTELEKLRLSSNNISDVSPLAGLTKLERLNLSSNNISDVSPLAGLTELSTLSLSSNNISDASPLAGLTGLSFLDLSSNNISDVSSLAGLTELSTLSLSSNNISDASPLAGLTKLSELLLTGNVFGVEYTVSEPEIYVGDTFTLDISARNILDLAGWQFNIIFDPAALEAIEVNEGDFLKTGGGTTFFQKGTIDNAIGKITKLSLARLSGDGVSGTGVLLSVRFRAKTTGQTRLKLENFQLAAITGVSIPTGLPEVAIIVERQLATGDINRDGQVSILDIILVAKHLGETAPSNSEVDVNGDGIVSILDVILVAGHLGESTAAAAPSMLALEDLEELDPTMVQAWIEQAQLEDDGSIAFRQGITYLQSLLILLIPQETALLPNYPNPFNPETWIPYQLSEPAEVTLRIYTVNGILVRTLALGHTSAGIYQSRSRAVYWDGKNDVGEPVASGVYFYTLTAGDFTATRKMLIRK